MPTQETTIAGLKLPGPVIAASGSMTQEASSIANLFTENGVDAVVPKTVAPVGSESVDPICNWVASKSPAGRSAGGYDFNCQGISRYSVERNVEIYEEVLSEVPDAFLIGSVLGTATSKQSWQDVMEPMAPHVKMFEANVSCPQNVIEKGDMGSNIGTDLDLLPKTTEWLVEICRKLGKPFSVKLSPNVTDPVSLARAAVDAGCTCLTLWNTFRANLGFDPETRVPMPNNPAHKGLGTNGAASGTSIHPQALELTRQVASNLLPEHPDLTIMGVGGVEDWRTAQNFFLFGCRAVQIYSALANPDGRGIVREIKSAMDRSMLAHGDNSLEDFRGTGLERFVSSTELVERCGGINAEGRFKPEEQPS